jgi:uncharacterized protein HemX
MIKRADGLSELPNAAQFAAAAALTGTPTDDGEAVQEISRLDRKEKSKKSVYIYVATLFIVVLLFTLLSYFVQQRNNSEISTLTQKNATAQLNIENLQSDNQLLQKESSTDRKQIADLQSQVTQLEKKLSDMQEQSKNTEKSDQQAYSLLLEKYNTLLEQYNTLAKQNGTR